MGIKYNKEFVKKDGRKLMSGGPRDLQRRQAQLNPLEDDSNINELTEEINKLREELHIQKNVGNKLFTAEQVDADINKIVGETIKELSLKHKKELEHQKTVSKELSDIKDVLVMDLKKQNEFLTNSLCKLNEGSDSEVASKLTALLKEVTEKLTVNGHVENKPTDPKRPQLEKVFIDPLESNAGDGLESHIEVKDVSITQKEAINDKVGKLRGLLGSLKT